MLYLLTQGIVDREKVSWKEKFSGHSWPLTEPGPVEILAAAASQSTVEGEESDEDEEKPPEGENQSESDHSSQEEGSEQSDTEKDIAEKVERISISEAEKADEQIEEEEEDPRSPEEKMDEIIENAFLQALKTNAKKMELPVLTRYAHNIGIFGTFSLLLEVFKIIILTSESKEHFI